LTAALQACRAFDVDILLLPEYSVRPETVAWLRESLATLAPNTSVWAGTYRKPPFLQNGDSDHGDWSAVLEVVVPQCDKKNNVRPRAKKYPSVALRETFRPSNVRLDPIYTTQQRGFDPRAYVMELICSEVFLATSPSNLDSIGHAHRALLQRFGTLATNPGAARNEVTREDLHSFATHTSLCASQFDRRSILLVPAMTTRAADFAVLGQAGFLAAGLTTVFCNAACNYGCGRSCFIGHDGWDHDVNHDPGIPEAGPYHGVQPGIYRPYLPERGWLGQREQAMVIADIDPVYSFEGKPRPQMLLPPLQLVAHLPLIESRKPRSAHEVEDHWCRCLRTSPQTKGNALFTQFHTMFLHADARGLENTISDTAPTELAEFLDVLASLGEPRGWLRKRKDAYLAGHSANPQYWPPPVAVDWLWVDLEMDDGEEYPVIEAPRYTTAPGERSPGFLQPDGEA
jgi:hypothetical protein